MIPAHRQVEDNSKKRPAPRAPQPAPRSPRYVDELTKLNEADQAKIMGGNLARLVAA